MTSEELAEKVLEAVTQEDLKLYHEGRDVRFICAVREKNPLLGVTDIRRAIATLREMGV